MKNKKPEITIYSKRERRWQNVKLAAEQNIEQAESELMLWREILKIAEKKIKK